MNEEQKINRIFIWFMVFICLLVTHGLMFSWGQQTIMDGLYYKRGEQVARAEMDEYLKEQYPDEKDRRRMQTVIRLFLEKRR